jgi:4-diphosphocytidyl-2-C-methyl-D-erythritol kinase
MNEWEREYPAPAKINLFLHIVGRRADGYHLLQTVFRLLDYGDTLRFSPRDDGRILRAAPLAGVPEEADLCLRAARLLREESGVDGGVTIALSKRLPMGGGLGGGSSDAATTLLALNRLWGANLPRQVLQKLGLRLGADVPFFIFGRNAFGEGVGEALQPVALPPAWYLVIEPPVSVPTGAIFAAPELTRNTKAIKIADFSEHIRSFPATALYGRNDLQPVVVARHPEVAQALEWLGRFGEARMSGSGACVFAAFAEREAALIALEQLPASWRGWVARGLNGHPLSGPAA